MFRIPLGLAGALLEDDDYAAALADYKEAATPRRADALLPTRTD